jgi:hypothetical protein
MAPLTEDEETEYLETFLSQLVKTTAAAQP